eukprot:GHVT01059710.1.p1 GENE.GHVT01059710.1~~GHVT01059710.1.p1  ORF type:complete len:644 (-),score=25.50 GHVT01059710.1:5133-7064(-)
MAKMETVSWKDAFLAGAASQLRRVWLYFATAFNRKILRMTFVSAADAMSSLEWLEAALHLLALAVSKYALSNVSSMPGILSANPSPALSSTFEYRSFLQPQSVPGQANSKPLHQVGATSPALQQVDMETPRATFNFLSLVAFAQIVSFFYAVATVMRRAPCSSSLGVGLVLVLHAVVGGTAIGISFLVYGSDTTPDEDVTIGTGGSGTSASQTTSLADRRLMLTLCLWCPLLLLDMLIRLRLSSGLPDIESVAPAAHAPEPLCPSAKTQTPTWPPDSSQVPPVKRMSTFPLQCMSWRLMVVSVSCTALGLICSVTGVGSGAVSLSEVCILSICSASLGAPIGDVLLRRQTRPFRSHAVEYIMLFIACIAVLLLAVASRTALKMKAIHSLHPESSKVPRRLRSADIWGDTQNRWINALAAGSDSHDLLFLDTRLSSNVAFSETIHLSTPMAAKLLQTAASNSATSFASIKLRPYFFPESLSLLRSTEFKSEIKTEAVTCILPMLLLVAGQLFFLVRNLLVKRATITAYDTRNSEMYTQHTTLCLKDSKLATSKLEEMTDRRQTESFSNFNDPEKRRPPKPDGVTQDSLAELSPADNMNQGLQELQERLNAFLNDEIQAVDLIVQPPMQKHNRAEGGTHPHHRAR